VKDTAFYPKLTFNFKGILRSFDSPLVMGIINATPDSFYASSRTTAVDLVLKRVGEMIADGADMIDLGGYSSRPGAADISEAEELSRVVPLITAIHTAFPDLLISIDTFRSVVADKALKAGASVINDISGGTLDERIFDVAASHKAPYILMHMRGNPQTTHTLNQYENMIHEMMTFFSHQTGLAKLRGVQDLILDPGFGFSKRDHQNFELLQQLEKFTVSGFPLLIGVSRKSMIYKTLGITPEESLNGTTVVNTIALLKGASFLRVHDVKEARQAVELVGIMTSL
jgi:dihydropteroate synthase